MVSVRSIQVLGLYEVLLSFSDGTNRVVDLSPYLEGDLFGPLREPSQFAAAYLDRETGTIAWPNGADIDPALLHRVGRPVVEQTLARGRGILVLSEPEGAAPGRELSQAARPSLQFHLEAAA